MKKINIRFLLSFLLTFAAVLTLAVSAFAAADVTFDGRQLSITSPGSVYTDSDLFDGFKNVMPGDELTETITVENKSRDFDYVRVYLKAIPHDENDNPISPEVLEKLTADERRGETEELAYMLDFLAQLDLTVTCEDTELFEGIASENGYTGDLADGVLIAKLEYGDTTELNVQLTVSTDLGSEYANRIGEVDWAFVVEGFNNPTPPPTIPRILTVRKVWADDGVDRPEYMTVQLLRSGKVFDTQKLSQKNNWAYTWVKPDDNNVWEIVEVDIPEGYEESYKILDHTTVITNTKLDIPPQEEEEEILPEEDDKPILPDTEETEDVPAIAGETETPDEPAAPVSLTVRKAWDDQNSRKRPDSAQITLYRGETAVETVVLGEWNNWTYTWNGLDGDAYWQAMEDDIPEGYAPVYSYADGVVTITNTAILIQTGQLKWPVPVMGGLGLALVACGIVYMTKKRKNHEA